MSDLAARIKDLTERIAGMRAELKETDPSPGDMGEQIGGQGGQRGSGSFNDLADIFFDNDRRQAERLVDLQRQLAAAEAELAQQVAASPAAPDVSLDYPLISVPNATGGSTIESPAVTSGGPSMGLMVAAGLVSVVLAVGAWQAFASSSPSPAATAATAAPVPTTTSRPAETAAAVVPSASTATTIRVTGQPAVYSGACNGYSITFSWIIEGAQSGRFQMRTAKGDTYGPVNGPFTLAGNGSSLTWEPATGRLTIRGASDVGASPGFRSQITTVNGLDVEGDATSIAAPGYCS